MDRETDFERKHKEDLERLHNFRLLDDDFMTKVFEDTKCAERELCDFHHRKRCAKEGPSDLSH